MTDPSTLSIELLALLVAAGVLALSGVSASLLIRPRGRASLSEPSPTDWRALARSRLLRPAVVVALATIAAMALMQVASPRLGSVADLDLALVTGALGGFAVLAVGTLLTELRREIPTDPRFDPTPRRPTRRGWIVAISIVAAAGGAALSAFMALYLALDGRVPAMLAAPLGAGLAALAARAADLDRDPLRSDGPAPPVAVTDLYLLLLSAAAGSSLLAFPPSVVRTLHPNAVLFPVAALAATFVAGLAAVAFGAAERRTSGAHLRVAVLATFAFASLALLALVPPYLDGSAALLVAAGVGPAASAAVVLSGTYGGPTASSVLRPAVRSAAPLLALVVVGLVAFRVGSGAFLGGGGVIDPSLGVYGLGLASAAMAGSLGGLIALDLGRRLSEPTPEEGPRSIGDAGPSVKVLSRAAGDGALVTAGLGGLVLLAGAWILLPIELGEPIGTLLGDAGLSTPWLALGLGLGALVTVLEFAAGGRSGFPRPGGASESSNRGRYGDAARPLALAIASTLLVGWALGGSGLFGFAVGATIGTLTLRSTVRPEPDGSTALPIPMLTVIVVSCIVFASALQAGSFGGHL